MKGVKEISIKLPTDYSEELLRNKIAKELRIKDFTYRIENKSLDARNRSFIHWLLKVVILSPDLKGTFPAIKPELQIPYRKRKENVVVIGSGPAGFFAAYVLQKAGFKTTIIERGTEVTKRTKGIAEFETSGIFNPLSNYAFGEGGAGTFSDGKLTSRSKHISLEKEFILDNYVDAGAPVEIKYMMHPHLGSDNLKVIVKNLRSKFIELGGTILFETFLTDFRINNGNINSAVTESGDIEAHYFLVAQGNSAYDTYRMLIKKGVGFRTKNFAIGCRMEHPQSLINLAQWGRESLPGVKAAEYRLTSEGDGKHPVYSFCMCPGGIVVPSAAFENTNIVNGMSNYRRNGDVCECSLCSRNTSR